MTSTRITSYWQVFRLIFVVFSLYLVGDAFYRWDGFRFYASFFEFLPSVALITVLWTIVAAITSMLVWLPFRLMGWFCQRIGWEVRKELFLLFMCIFVLLGVMAWAGRRLIWPHMLTPTLLKQAVLLVAAIIAILLTWMFRNKSERWMNIIQERIAPLVWLFGFWLILSVPLVAYQTWIKHADKVVLQGDSQSTIADKDRPNIILITFDALTARDMSVYGYHRLTTPFITKWAKKASLFMKAEAESTNTQATTPSLMTGKRVWTHRNFHLNSYSKPVKSDIENLPLVLRNNGYYTMAFVANRYASVEALGIAESFDVAPITTDFVLSGNLPGVIDKSLFRLFSSKFKLYDWFVKEDFILTKILNLFSRDISITTVPPEKAFNRFLSVIGENPPAPFFAWIHLFPPHDPYLPPAPYMGMFDSSSELRTFNQQDKAVKYRLEHQGDLKEVQPIVDKLRARYDEFIRYCDKQFEDFMEQLIMRKILKNTVVILSSDHGESFEHNSFRHKAPHLYEQLTHIPLIIKEPEQMEGRVIHELVEQIDIPATILDLANIPVPSWTEGCSLVPLMRGEKVSPRLAFSMNFEKNPRRGHQITRGALAVWEGDYKLIHYLEEKKSLLFNLKHDPDELNNLFDQEPEIGQRLLSLIQNNLKKANERISRGE